MTQEYLNWNTFSDDSRIFKNTFLDDSTILKNTFLDDSRIFKNTLNVQFEPYIVLLQISPSKPKILIEPTMLHNEHSLCFTFST
jgi:hypothetical protein